MEAALQGWPRAAQPVHTQAHAGEPLPPALIERKPRLSRGKLIAIFLGAASLSPCSHVGDMAGKTSVQSAAVAATLPRSGSGVVEKPRALGPSVPSEEDLAQEFMGEIGGDVWIHPLAGPVRRMPIRGSRVFGAARHGDRPGECRNGHCGVDLGGEMWGEPIIMAVHDGVVDRVKRVDEGSGGMYVRLAHRDGKLFSQYFHLAAIPRELNEGDKVKAGQVIGLLGDTGVKESTAHLHFAISVKATPTSREIYMDPEPLIALWPLKVPRAYGGADAAWDPGVPLGAAGRPKLDGNGDFLPRRADVKRKKRRAAAPPSDEAGEGGAGEDAAETASESPGVTDPAKESKPARFPFAPAAAEPSTTP
jgi:murein DD-endopeptidase MepM/ murein hydrolase activator NlpD